jgi:hypothetical protein
MARPVIVIRRTAGIVGKVRNASFLLFYCIVDESIELNKSSIDRFHSRDRWPQWGGETIRNI